jgi:hypothetical protein
MKQSVKLALGLVALLAAGRADAQVDPCADKDSPDCVWSEYGAPSLIEAQGTGQDVIRVNSYMQAGPWLSVMAEFRHVPGFGTLLTVHDVMHPSAGRLFERVPEETWLAARRNLTTLQDAFVAAGLLKIADAESICIDGNTLRADWLLDGKIGHVAGYQCEHGAVISFTHAMRKLVVDSIPYCAATGSEDLRVCMLLDGDKYVAARGVAAFAAIQDKTCQKGETAAIMPFLAPDVMMRMNYKPVAHGARDVLATWHALVCDKTRGMLYAHLESADGAPNGAGVVTATIAAERDEPMPEIGFSCIGTCEGWMSQEWRMAGGRPKLTLWDLGGFSPTKR